MEFNYSPTGASSLPSWQQSFSAPSVVPGDYSSAFGSSWPSTNTSLAYTPGFTIPGVSYAPPSPSAAQPASSNWKDYLTAGGYILDKAGQAIRAYRGEPISPGGSSLSTDIEAEEKRRAGEESLAKLLKEIGGSSSTDAIAGVLDPAADRRKNPRSFDQLLPSLASLVRPGGTRLAGDVFS